MGKKKNINNDVKFTGDFTDNVTSFYGERFRIRSYGNVQGMIGWYVIGTRWDNAPKTARIRIICPQLDINMPLKGIKDLNDPEVMKRARETAQAVIAEMNLSE